MVVTFSLGLVILSTFPQNEAKPIAKQMQTDYRWFHQNPELSHQEHQTSAYFAERSYEGFGEIMKACITRTILPLFIRL